MKAPCPGTIIRLLALTALVVAPGCGGSQPPEPEPLVTSPPAQLPPPEEEPAVRDESAIFADVEVPDLDPIHFDFNEYRITPAARLTLQDVSAVMKEHPHWTLLLEGHCDERGTDQYNLALGENRAQAAKRYLVSLGVGEDRFQTVSYGEERPAEIGHDETAWARNRRAEFRVRAPGS